MAPIQIGFSRRKRWNPISALITFFTGSPATHAWLLVEVCGEPIVFEASNWSFRTIHLETMQQYDEIVRTFVPKYPLEAGFARMLHELHRPFDVLGLIGMAIVMLGRRLRRKWRNPIHGDRALFCSEMVARVCVHADYPGFHIDPDEVTPADLMEFFLAEAEQGGCPAPQGTDPEKTNPERADPDSPAQDP